MPVSFIFLGPVKLKSLSEEGTITTVKNKSNPFFQLLGLIIKIIKMKLKRPGNRDYTLGHNGPLSCLLHLTEGFKDPTKYRLSLWLRTGEKHSAFLKPQLVLHCASCSFSSTAIWKVFPFLATFPRCHPAGLQDALLSEQAKVPAGASNLALTSPDGKKNGCQVNDKRTRKGKQNTGVRGNPAQASLYHFETRPKSSVSPPLAWQALPWHFLGHSCFGLPRTAKAALFPDCSLA